MAKPALVKTNKPAPAPAAPEPVAQPKKRLRWLLAIVTVVLILGASGGAWWYLRGNGAHDAETPKVATAKPPVFFTLEPFTVNLMEENGDHYLQLSIVLQVEDDKVGDQIKTYLPIIRNKMLLMLSAKRPSDLATAEGKERLIAELLRVSRESLPGTTPERGVNSAYLSAFVIQ
ncbi:MAG TPA: flagellar basal body-associated protein FliL [Casimicrobiaceae bacterium]|nr:flagellar basal body-associated protein FliL [Casimicrobiaceae bacterium]